MTTKPTDISLNVGNIWTDRFLDKVIELNKLHAGDGIQVTSIYGSISGLTPTARSYDRIPYMDWSPMRAYIEKAQDAGIAIRYTLNASCLGKMQGFKRDWDCNLRKNISNLHQAGVREWTVTSPLLMMELRKMFPTDFLEVSTIAEVSSPHDIERWLACDADGFNLATKVNRNFPLLKALNDNDAKITLLANEFCLYDCAFRRDCYNLSSHDSERSTELFDFYPFRLCNQIRMDNPVEWLKARTVLPQHMTQYASRTGITNFKLAFRTHPYEVAIPILEHYMNQIFTGNLCELWPTISKLGDTQNPAESVYISTMKLDEADFLRHFIQYGDKCDNRCDVGCVLCDKMLAHATKGH